MTTKEFSSSTRSLRVLTVILVFAGFTLFVASAFWLLVLIPLSPKVQLKFFGIDQSRNSKMFALNINETVELLLRPNSFEDVHCQEVRDPSGKIISSDVIQEVEPANQTVYVNASKPMENKLKQPFQGFSNDSSNVHSVTNDGVNNGDAAPSNFSKSMEKLIQPFSGFSNDSSNVHSRTHDNLASSNSSMPTEKIKQTFLGFSNDSSNVYSGGHNDNVAPSNSTMTTTVLSSSSSSKKVDSSSCDLYQGKWFYDPSGPLYTNSTCPVLTQMQNCQGNGRPDKEYENWRWKPAQCDLPRFNVTEFFELMRGKTLAFIGDSIARNQMESLLCILWQVEEPKNLGRKGFHRWYFSSTSTTIVRIWSSWLVNNTLEPFQHAPKGITKLHLDIPDDYFMKHLHNFDVVVISGGHWFNKKSAYILNNKIVGGQLWLPNNTLEMKVDKAQAFAISTETALSAIASHPKFTGLAILRSFAPNHYEGGAWNTGGTCTGKHRPASENELVKNEYTDVMHQKQAKAFNSAIKKGTNKSKMRYMNITRVFGYRHDGHPGPYRSENPKKLTMQLTMQGSHEEVPTQDCLHWCMPGAVDTWNEIVLEIIRREFRGPP